MKTFPCFYLTKNHGIYFLLAFLAPTIYIHVCESEDFDSIYQTGLDKSKGSLDEVPFYVEVSE